MTFEEAIKHCEEVAELNEECSRIYNEQSDTMASYSCKECASEHRQLAEWLRELKAYREELKNGNLRGCINCKYDYIDIADYPCASCEKTDLWRVKTDENNND